MSLKPTKFSYQPPTHIAGQARDFTSSIDITEGTAHKWTVQVKITSIEFPTSGDAQKQLRAELLRLAEALGGGS